MLNIGAEIKMLASLLIFFILHFQPTAAVSADGGAKDKNVNAASIDIVRTVSALPVKFIVSSTLTNDKAVAEGQKAGSPPDILASHTNNQNQIDTYGKTAQKVKSKLDVQTTLPTALFERADVQNCSNGWFLASFGALFNIIAKALLYLSLIVAFYILIKALIDSLKLPKDEEVLAASSMEDGDCEAEKEAVAARMDQAQTAADELAKIGNFAEAIHVLLFQSLNELRRALGLSIAASLTSREILSRVNISVEAKKMFSNIVTYVELSYFGARRPREEDYIFCRGNFEGLSQALRSEAFQLHGNSPRILR